VPTVRPAAVRPALADLLARLRPAITGLAARLRPGR